MWGKKSNLNNVSPLNVGTQNQCQLDGNPTSSDISDLSHDFEGFCLVQKVGGNDRDRKASKIRHKCLILHLGFALRFHISSMRVTIEKGS
jgi:hypothetical protein